MRIILILLTFLFLMPALGSAQADEITNKLCPVMEGNPVDPNIFVDYQGKRVYLCCEICRAEFTAHPEKYLSKLPQFQSSTLEASASVQQSETQPAKKRPQIGKLIQPLGLVTALLMLIAVITGLNIRKSPKKLFKLHKYLGILALIIGAAHGFLVFFLSK
ncbi:MAG: hypothetical protein PHW04_17295 [Candidatus Wallbacteria bacterium]|nr:hypothetical protein [Candidatus Wallbacteria bacterium]